MSCPISPREGMPSSESCQLGMSEYAPLPQSAYSSSANYPLPKASFHRTTLECKFLPSLSRIMPPSVRLETPTGTSGEWSQIGICISSVRWHAFARVQVFRHSHLRLLRLSSLPKSRLAKSGGVVCSDTSMALVFTEEWGIRARLFMYSRRMSASVAALYLFCVGSKANCELDIYLATLAKNFRQLLEPVYLTAPNAHCSNGCGRK
ncbi:hypothetical protein EV421DRAFT_1247466 [Armillaria borealis]|uniref:Uncharacterized protein n=1 Tax=Armillaria borealis TaxID=47425 RepID=A0AA39J383_9AGAR|nr:hypothetical protein EV421DRAFT_1247466 [Armillaria borealis]